uniref:Uncharacterized protein n=1 Tax=Aegilops tauschii subsp. strangulata TaxID=200361 RepID=A0A453NYS9_AEGTS
SMFSYLPIFFFKPSELYSSLFCNVLFTLDFLFFPIMLCYYNLDALFQQCVCVSSFNPMFSHLPIFFLIFWNYKFASLLPLSMHRKKCNISEIVSCSCLLFLLIVLFASGLISACRLSTLAW